MMQALRVRQKRPRSDSSARISKVGIERCSVRRHEIGSCVHLSITCRVIRHFQQCHSKPLKRRSTSSRTPLPIVVQFSSFAFGVVFGLGVKFGVMLSQCDVSACAVPEYGFFKNRVTNMFTAAATFAVA